MARFQYGRTKADKAMWEEALTHMARLHGEHPQNQTVMYNLGCMLWESSRRNEAKTIWTKYLELESSGPHVQRVKIRMEQP